MWCEMTTNKKYKTENLPLSVQDARRYNFSEANKKYVDFMNNVFSKSSKQQRKVIMKRMKVADNQLSYHENSRSKKKVEDVM